MPLFRFVLVEQGQPDWGRAFECADDQAAVAEGHALVAHQLMLRPAAALRMTVARVDGTVLGHCGPDGAFEPAPDGPA
ncbi:hypothetical protein [Phenylobacterium sp.]|uniref:hypothetical protein n=1 Tax=Phenylobacterium sp. TaxID=1871053 RepID=UPI002F95BC04